MTKKHAEEEIVSRAGGRFILASLLEKRYKELLFAGKSLVDTTSDDAFDVLVEEVMQDKIELVPEEEALAAAAAALLSNGEAGEDSEKAAEESARAAILGEERETEEPAVAETAEDAAAAAEKEIEGLGVAGKALESPDLVALSEADDESLPGEPGIYGWYFDQIPPGVPTENCVSVKGWTLLYVGVAKDEGIAKRVLRKHLAGNAEASTLRKSLGCLLRKKLSLTPVKQSTARWTFGEDEAKLTTWMTKHCSVACVSLPEEAVKDVELALVERYSLPLNLEHSKHPFRKVLKAKRKECKDEALGG